MRRSPTSLLSVGGFHWSQPCSSVSRPSSSVLTRTSGSATKTSGESTLAELRVLLCERRCGTGQPARALAALSRPGPDGPQVAGDLRTRVRRVVRRAGRVAAKVRVCEVGLVHDLLHSMSRLSMSCGSLLAPNSISAFAPDVLSSVSST